jgi:DNA-binding transcriptional regulator YiaG
MGKKYYSEATMAIHESAKELFEAGVISKAKMRKFDNACFVAEAKDAFDTEESVKLKTISPAVIEAL